MIGYLKKVFFRDIDAAVPAGAAAGAASPRGSVGAVAPPATIRPRRSPVAVVPESEALRGGPSVPTISLVLSSISAQLPPELRDAATRPIPEHCRVDLPLEKISAQLAQGAVRITFGELRVAAPAGLFLRNDELDGQLITLPLSDILAQLKPARRMHQRRVEVSQDIPSIFGADGNAPRDETPSPEPGLAPALPFQPVQIEEPAADPIPAPAPALKFVLKEDAIAQPAPAPIAPVPMAPAESVIDIALDEPEPDVVQAAAEEPMALDEEPIGTPAPIPLPTLSPQAAVAAALSMQDVAGALCATSDGLLIAGEMPAGVNVRTMAALLPGLLTRIGQYTATAQLGALDATQLTVGGARLEARRVAGISFAVLGKPGADVDAQSVTHIAGRLGPQAA